jgi:hypothetical protein
LLGGVTLALYSPVVAHPFITYDDPEYVTGNPHVQAGLEQPDYRLGLHLDRPG